MELVECLVVCAGVISLAVARALARAGRELIVVESESGIGAGQFAQQRSHPCRHLLSDRAGQDAALGRRQGDALRILRRAWRLGTGWRTASDHTQAYGESLVRPPGHKSVI